MTDAQLLLAVVVLAPLVVLGLAGMVRGYHMKIKVNRPRRHDDGDR